MYCSIREFDARSRRVPGDNRSGLPSKEFSWGIARVNQESMSPTDPKESNRDNFAALRSRTEPNANQSAAVVISAQKAAFDSATRRPIFRQGIAIRDQEFGCSLHIGRPDKEIEVKKYESILKNGEIAGKDRPALQNDHFDAFPIETIQDPFKASLEQEIPRNVYLISRFETRRQGLRKQRCESPTLQMPKQQWSKLSFAAQMARDITGPQLLEFFYGPLDYGLCRLQDADTS